MYHDNVVHSYEHINRPHHIYIEGAYYFLTGRCFEAKKYFYTINRKDIFVSVLKNLQKELGISIYGWVLLDNHYHMLCRVGELTFSTPYNNISSQQKTLVKFVKRLHSVTSLLLNRQDQTPGRKILYQYWDYC